MRLIGHISKNRWANEVTFLPYTLPPVEQHTMSRGFGIGNALQYPFILRSVCHGADLSLGIQWIAHSGLLHYLDKTIRKVIDHFLMHEQS